MSEKKFRLSSETVLQYKIMDNDTDLNESEVVDLLNKLYEENEQLKKSEKINREYAEQIVEENQKLRIAKNDLRIENEQLRKQIQNYEQLISNSYVGEEETLDGFVGKYVIWEDELQKYKNKNEMIDNG